MTQADCVLSTPPTNTSRSRRAVLAGIASAAVLPIAATIPTTAPAFPTAVTTIDPIFAAIDAFRCAEMEFYADRDGDIPDQVGDRWSHAVDVVITTQPTTPAGLGALTSFARDMVERAHSGDASFTVRQKLLVMAVIDDATRGMSGLEPWSPLTVPANISANSRTPAIEAIERYRKASELFDRCGNRLTEAREAVKEEKHDPEPYALIHWRNYYVGGSELKRVRKDFLRLGEDPATIELEYRDAKKRYRAQVKAAKNWERRVGLEDLCESMEQARAEWIAARKALGNVRLRSIADASAILELIRPEVKFGDIQDWEIAALNNASKYLAAVTKDNANA
jgi:hypothetical protein